MVRWSWVRKVPGRPTVWMKVGQGPIALAVGACGFVLDLFTLLYPFPPFSLFLKETTRYRLKYYLKGPLNPTQQEQQSLMVSFYAVFFPRDVLDEIRD